jgi:hypothetical protein
MWRLAGLCLTLAAGALAQTAPPRPLWFDAAQLPSFTGTVERYLGNPAGETDALILREGPQVIFPPDIASALREAAPPGRPVVVFGIRARAAPVITMLGYAPPGETPPVMLDRFYWRHGRAEPKPERMAVGGTVHQPYWSAQGEVIGAVLEDGTVIVVPRDRAEAFRELLKPGATIAAEGQGQAGETGRAILADKVGDKPDALRPVADPAAPR